MNGIGFNSKPQVPSAKGIFITDTEASRSSLVTKGQLGEYAHARKPPWSPPHIRRAQAEDPRVAELAVDVIARAEILGAHGLMEVQEGTTIHPF